MAKIKKLTVQGRYDNLSKSYDRLKKYVSEYVLAVQSRRGTAHSTTPQTNGDKASMISVAELITITDTAKLLNKHVVLEVVSSDPKNPQEKKLTLNLVDTYPSIPYEMKYPEL